MMLAMPTVFDLVCIGYILHCNILLTYCITCCNQPGTTSSETCSLLELSLCRLQFQVDINYADICDPVLNGPAAEQQCKEKLWDLWELVHVGSCRFGSPEFYSLLCVCVCCVAVQLARHVSWVFSAGIVLVFLLSSESVEQMAMNIERFILCCPFFIPAFPQFTG